MYKIIVRREQDNKLELLELNDSGKYSDQSRVLYDSRTDGEIPQALQAQLDVDILQRENSANSNRAAKETKKSRVAALKLLVKNRSATLEDVLEILEDLI